MAAPAWISLLSNPEQVQLASLPAWAPLAIAFSTFVTVFAIVASTIALLSWDTIHWPWSRVKRCKVRLTSIWDPKSLATQKLRYNDILRREIHLGEKLQSILGKTPSLEDGSWPENAEKLRALMQGGYLSLESITSSNGMLDFFASHRVLARQDSLQCCLGIRMTVHYNLFCGTVLALGSEAQRQWLIEAQRRSILGCFLLTETGAGVLSGLVVETQVTWVWSDIPGEGYFELHTPSGSAEKTWISQGLAAEWGVVVAQLVVDGQARGAHAFLVDMTSPGVSRQCMGAKTTFNALDNARVSFDRVRLPSTALLSKFCSVQPRWCQEQAAWQAEYSFVGDKPPSFVLVAQRLLSGRLCISDSAIAYLEGVLQATKDYTEKRFVWVDKERKMPLAQLPYMAKVLRSVEVGLNVHKAFLLLLQMEFAEAVEGGRELPRQLVTKIAAAKVEAVEFAIKSLALLRRDVGSYSLMACSPFGAKNDVLLCCRFAEGDSRVLQQMLTRDLVRAHSSRKGFLDLMWRVLKAWISGAPHSSGKLSYLRDQQLVQLLWVLKRHTIQSRRSGISKAQAETDAWLHAGDLVYDVAKTHAQQLIHSAVEQQLGPSHDTDRFLDMSVSDCEARHMY
mmetsp:Transcript_26433/g.47686  ORF Transcript_26433/g.47686 Transcript_26433/m.47686 type:complete len:621 (+) Transcript_26433:61-1923(+)|eukprot:CAMPEP_0197636690 /NCGR_PEP_ID=MMETSP1338-20131121/12116_1 /TAXON_ID=43686 ORGANISM="Pelagodinium beii, Strain RCC1491" /NCGR_SAMPLE_ID=MMETSP1338 /ASSEMBLY_ACC=CAM_ASM_000754 /LENGTH=620 /DNA_ID=CAMNT_0043208963 /DNA_START=41 /DNA_END=1903 /DNA_ORIENTATION=-